MRKSKIGQGMRAKLWKSKPKETGPPNKKMETTLHIKIKDMAHNTRYGSMDVLLELLLELLLPQLYVFIT